MEHIAVFGYLELPENIRKMLIDYYKGTDQREILNNSYTRYPYLFDFQDNITKTELDKFFTNQTDSTYVIIHWEW